MPNLSFERLAIVLALTGCNKATPAADGMNSVRSDPSASAAAQTAVATPPPPAVAASAVATTAAPASPAPHAGASAIELRKKMDMRGPGGSTGQASCGAGSCTSEIKKK
ncbi:MAG TPA: hypothetical protein VH054_27620 [Polyangiaceae bacterium]|jgi:hypothetical protein|nr:hypothetical protein [Polyangiaceae bacterium]